jgi:hypothetical protein
MNDKAKLEKYRGLSITALVTGLLTALAIPQIFRWSTNMPVYNLEELLIKLTTVFILAIGLPLAAVIMGSILSKLFFIFYPQVFLFSLSAWNNRL